MQEKPYTVITSRTAKDHLEKARSLMNETQQGMLAQRQLVQQKMSEQSALAREDQVTAAANAHEQSMQLASLAGGAMIK